MVNSTWDRNFNYVQAFNMLHDDEVTSRHDIKDNKEYMPAYAIMHRWQAWQFNIAKRQYLNDRSVYMFRLINKQEEEENCFNLNI